MAITTVLTTEHTQIIRLPAEVRLPEGVRKVEIRANGNALIISPIQRAWDGFFLDRTTLSTDFPAERASQNQDDRDTL